MRDLRTKCLAGTAAFLAAGLLARSAAAQSQVQVDPSLPEYTPVQGVSGTIKSVGSDTMNNLMTLWGEKFKTMYPNVSIEIEGKGSSTAPPALIEGASSFGPMSREMKDAEKDAFKSKFGYEPVALRTAIDMLAVYVHKDNPIAKKGLTFSQVDGVYSQTLKGGGKDVETWGELGLDGDWAAKPIALYGRNSASGTYGFFKEHALFNGDFKSSVKEQPGSASVVQAVASDKAAIGYSGIGYKTADVAAVPLAKGEGEAFEAAEPANVSKYPMSRPLLLYVNASPSAPLDPLRREFVKLVFSKQGQEVVIKDGYLPVSWAVAQKSLAAAGIEAGKD